MEKLRQDPRTAELMKDPGFVNDLRSMQTTISTEQDCPDDSSILQQQFPLPLLVHRMLKDPRILTALSVLLGVDLQAPSPGGWGPLTQCICLCVGDPDLVRPAAHWCTAGLSPPPFRRPSGAEATSSTSRGGGSRRGQVKPGAGAQAGRGCHEQRVCWGSQQKGGQSAGCRPVLALCVCVAV